jgi:DNA polymerase I
MSQSVYIVDALNYIYRAYHSVPDSITSPSGMLTNAVLGYLRTLLRIVKERKPAYMVAAFERDTSFRSAIFTGYKANRTRMPDALAPQIDYCRQITEAIGITCLEADDFEADDIIGTVAVRMSGLGYETIVVTGDKDMSQLVCDGIRVYDIAKEVWLDEQGVRNKFGVAPCQIPDLLALHGDSIDNIPGVTGVGEKTARQILSVCQSVEDIVGSPQLLVGLKFRGRDEILRRIRDNFETVRLSRRLATICCEVPIEVTPERVRYRRGDFKVLSPLCNKLGFHRVMEDIPLAQPMLFT